MGGRFSNVRPMSDFNIEIGKRVRDARKRSGKTQKELATALDRTQSNMSQLESGDVEWSAHVVAQIARILDVHLSELWPPDA